MPLTPLQQGLLFHASTTGGNDDDVYAMQLDITVTGPLDPDRLRDAVHTVVNRHPNLAARFCRQFDQPIQIIPADPATPWQYVELDSGVDVDEQIQRVCAAERAAVCDLAHPPAFRVALIRTAPDRHRIVLTNHHIVLDGWSLPILVQEIFAGYYGQRLPAAASYRRFVTWLADRDLEAAHAAWREVLAGFDTPTLVGPPGRSGPGPARHRIGPGARGDHAGPQRAGPLVPHHRQHRAPGRLGAAADGADRPATMSSSAPRSPARPAEVAGAESMVGLLINTVPVRAHITPATTIADLLDQLQSAHNHTLDHQHLALTEIHRATGHDQLFDTLFVYENYPIDTAALFSANGLAITEITGREYNHYPLTMQAMPGTELGLRVEFDTDVFDTGQHRHAHRAVQAGVGGHDRRSAQS